MLTFCGGLHEVQQFRHFVYTNEQLADLFGLLVCLIVEVRCNTLEIINVCPERHSM